MVSRRAMKWVEEMVELTDGVRVVMMVGN